MIKRHIASKVGSFPAGLTRFIGAAIPTAMEVSPDKPIFVVDRMLGGLAKWLRVAGFDALYSSAYNKEDLTIIEKQTGRTIITRDTRFGPAGGKNVVVLRNNYTIGQVKELFKRLGIVPDPKRYFTRCIICNSELVTVMKDDVKDSVPPYVFATCSAFSRCPSCKKVYWGGTHKDQMLRTLDVILRA